MGEESPLPDRAVPAQAVPPGIIRRWLGVLSEPARRIIAGADLSAPHLSLHLPAAGRELRALRRGLTTWLQQLHASPVQIDDVLLAVSEAATNAIEHAYDEDAPDATSKVLVLAVSDEARQTAAVIVADTGHWRTEPADPGFRGRGLPLMRAVTDQFHLHHGRSGTTVVLGWTLH